MNNPRIATGAAATAIFLGFLYWQGLVDANQLLWAGVTAAGTCAVYWLYKKDYLGDIGNPFDEAAAPSPLEDKKTFNEMKGELREWAEESYSGDDNVEIELERADFSTKELKDWDQVLHCVANALGPADENILIFYEATSGNVLEHKKMRAKKDMLKEPFRYSDHYQEYKRRTRGGGDVQTGPRGNWFNAMMASQAGMSAGLNSGRKNSSGEDQGDGEE